MAEQSKQWQELLKLARSEKNRERRNDLCQRARRLVQDVSLESASNGGETNKHVEEKLNKALRDLWVIQNSPL
jgi:hypothetical protein